MPSGSYLLSDLFMFAAVTVRVRSPSVINQTSTIPYLERSFVVPLTMRFYSSIHFNFTTSDWCLAAYKNDHTWTCVSPITAESAGVFISTVNTTGMFAVMFRIMEVEKPAISSSQRSQVIYSINQSINHSLFISRCWHIVWWVWYISLYCYLSVIVSGVSFVLKSS